MRKLEQTWGVAQTYCYSTELLDFEIYVVLVEETYRSFIYALSAVFLVTFIMTGSFTAAALVLISVLVVNLFLFVMVPFFNLTINQVVIVQLLASVALSALFSLFLILTYMMEEPPDYLKR